MISCNNVNHLPGYVFGSSIITIIIGSLSFIVALAWNSAIQKSFEKYESGCDALDARFSYAFAVTAMAIVLAFIIMYFIDGCKW